jgi:hypothetical protein
LLRSWEWCCQKNAAGLFEAIDAQTAKNMEEMKGFFDPSTCNKTSFKMFAKQMWCCINERVQQTCTAETDCNFKDFKNLPKKKKKQFRRFCCVFQHLHCPKVIRNKTALASKRKGLPNDCTDYATYATWSDAKKVFCYDHWGIGVEPSTEAPTLAPTTPAPSTTTQVVTLAPLPPNTGTNCMAFANWQNTFSPAKKQRCCSVWGQKPGIWEGPPDSKGLCCDFFKVGCAAAVVVHGFNCTEPHDYQQKWTIEWSEAKNSYCCYMGMAGSASSTGSVHVPGCMFRCSEGTADTWPPAQKAWCCTDMIVEIPAVRKACGLPIRLASLGPSKYTSRRLYYV